MLYGSRKRSIPLLSRVQTRGSTVSREIRPLSILDEYIDKLAIPQSRKLQYAYAVKTSTYRAL